MFTRRNDQTVQHAPIIISMQTTPQPAGELEDKSGLCRDIENFECGMREFAVYDHNGYLLQFWLGSC